MALFTAAQAGAIDDGATFGNTSPGVKGTDWPSETDGINVNGYDLTQGTATGVGSMDGGDRTFTLTGSFSCPDVSEAQIIVPNGVTAAIAFGTCSYSGSGKAIECQLGGTVTNVTGTLNNTGSGYGAYNSGTWTDFSGELNNSGSGYGAYNNYSGTWTDFSGTLNNSGNYGAANSGGTWTDFSGTLNNTGGFYGVDNGGTWSDFSGQCFDSGSGSPFSGYIENCSGIIGRPSSQTDCIAANILSGKTILGVDGTASAGGGPRSSMGMMG